MKKIEKFFGKNTRLVKNYIANLSKEYIEILLRDGSFAKNFWNFPNKIYKDKRKIGVVIDMRRSRMINNILELLDDKVIDFNDLEEFRDELKETIKYFTKNWR